MTEEQTLADGADAEPSELGDPGSGPVLPAGRRAEPGGQVRSGTGRRSWVLVLAAGLVYGAIALAAYWPIWPGDPHQIAGSGADPWQAAWFLEWTSWALLHGHNPWVTHYFDYPRTVNLAQNTSMPLLGFLGMPVTLTLGPIATFNLFAWLAFPVSATACFVLLRRWVRWIPAAFIGGLLYGFSPYMVSQGLGHINLTFVPFPPLVLLVLDELLVRQRRRAVPMGIVLGLLLALEYFVSSEVFGSTVVVAAIGVVVLALARPRSVLEHARHALPGLAAGVLVCGVLISYPALIQFAGPGAYSGPPQHGVPYPADVLAPVVPTHLQVLAPSSLANRSLSFTSPGNLSENDSYLGIPLLLALLAVVVWRWRSLLVRFAATMAAAATVLSWGPWAEVDGRDTAFPLPDALFNHLPFFSDFLFSRFALYADLFCAVLLAVGVDRARRALTRSGVVGARHAPRRAPRWMPPAAIAGSLVVVFAPLAPVWPYAAAPLSIPSAFTTAARLHRIPAGSVVLTYPYAEPQSDQGMLWQEVASMRFRLMGGYALVRGPTGASTYDSFPTGDPSVPATLASDWTGTPLATLAPGATTATPQLLRQFLRSYSVSTVVFEPGGANAPAAYSLFASVLGKPKEVDGLAIWYHVPSRIAARLG